MRHRKASLKLNKTSSHRKAMFRNMVTSLFKHDRIRTTDAKAKELRSWADHLITLAKRGDLHARRQALSIVREKDVVHKLFEEAATRFESASGGYTRVIKLGRRRGDAAPISLVELVELETGKKKKVTKKKGKAEVDKKPVTREKPVTDKEEDTSVERETDVQKPGDDETVKDETVQDETALDETAQNTTAKTEETTDAPEEPQQEPVMKDVPSKDKDSPEFTEKKTN
jgi:large subunit ribosomal protein L17